MLRKISLIVIISSPLIALAAQPTWFDPNVDAIIERVNNGARLLLDPSLPESLLADIYHQPEARQAVEDARDQGSKEMPPSLRLGSPYRKPGPMRVDEALPLALKDFNFAFSYFRGHVFVQGHHLKHLEEFSSGTMTWEKLMGTQPWLEWESTQLQYGFRVGGATKAILETYRPGEVIHLYRGTVNAEALYLAKLKIITEQGRCDNVLLRGLLPVSRAHTQTHQVVAQVIKEPNRVCSNVAERLIQALAQDITLDKWDHGGFFYSAEYEFASRFAKGSVIEVRLTREQLEVLDRQRKLYFGMESGSEFAVLGVDGLKALIRGFQGRRPFHSDVYFVGDGLADHAIWKKP